jgi:hypothetical protein
MRLMSAPVTVRLMLYELGGLNKTPSSMPRMADQSCNVTPHALLPPSTTIAQSHDRLSVTSLLACIRCGLAMVIGEKAE